MKPCQCLVHAVMHQHAAVDAYEPAGLLVDESERAAGTYGKPGVVAVAKLSRRRRHRRDLDSGQASHPFQGVFNVFALDLQLLPVTQVLPLAPGAVAVVRARRRHPCSRRFNHFYNSGGGIFSPDADHFGDHPFSGNPAQNEDTLAFEFGQGFAQTSPGIGRQRDMLASGNFGLSQASFLTGISFRNYLKTRLPKCLPLSQKGD